MTKEISSRELVSFYLGKIKEKNDSLNAFLTIDEENALKEADRLDSLSEEEKKALPLFGIPIALKDIFSTKNLTTTAASKVLENYIPPYDATATDRYKKAGAIILGKTNLDAWAHGSSGENSDFGPARNPHNPDYVPGGSSSGSAVAVAADMCLAASGTDTGGSIRLPAAFCGVVGLKPTYGRVSRYGIIAMGSSFDSIGHMTRNVYDNALILETTAGHDYHDMTTSDIPIPHYSQNLEKDLKGLKIGIIKEFFSKGLDTEIKTATERAIKQYESMGCEIIDVTLPHAEYAMEVYYILIPAEVSSNLGRMDGVRFGFSRDKFGDEARRRIMIGTYTLSAGYYDAHYNKALKVRTLIKQDFEEAFKKVDVLIAPTSPTPPFKLGEKVNDPLAMYLSDIYVCPVNIAGIPALNIPIEKTHGFPTGMQIIGPQFSEQLLYQVGYQYEKLR